MSKGRTDCACPSLVGGGENKQVNLYTDSGHVFVTLHAQVMIYKERGLLTAEGNTIKNKEKLLALLKAIWLSK